MKVKLVVTDVLMQQQLMMIFNDKNVDNRQYIFKKYAKMQKKYIYITLKGNLASKEWEK